MVTSCAGWVEPLNLECILVNTLAGSMEIFVFLALIFIAMVGARFRIYFLTIMIAGLVIAFGIGRIIKT